jgi:sugar phosphate isomerase/epimerase
MNRRTFLQQSGRALAAAPMYSVASGLFAGSVAEAAMQNIPPGVLSRLGITTVCFRERFAKTRSRGAAPPAGGDLTLLTAPKFIADNLGLHNVEIWNFQFDDTSLDYCKKIKAAADAAGSKIIDLQLDLGANDNLSDPDATKRAASLKMIKEWMDRAAACGSPRMRANTGAGTEANWNPKRTADGFRELADYGEKIGVMILIENHIGYSANIDKVVEVVKLVNHRNCGVICDWGNTPASGSISDKVAALSKLFPYLKLVSAKELDFNAQNKHTSYDIVPIIKATEASGYKGIYSIEFYSEAAPPPDPVAAAKEMIKVLAANIAPAAAPAPAPKK